MESGSGVWKVYTPATSASEGRVEVAREVVTNRDKWSVGWKSTVNLRGCVSL